MHVVRTGTINRDKPCNDGREDQKQSRACCLRVCERLAQLLDVAFFHADVGVHEVFVRDDVRVLEVRERLDAELDDLRQRLDAAK